MKNFKKTRGMSIPEILISLVIATFLIGIVLAGWYYAYKNWAVDRVRTELRVNLEMAVERLKGELRLSSATYMSLYDPLGGSNYKAVSFPVATKNANGFLTLDADGNIFWDKSVIYHTYDNAATGETELKRTEFADNNSFLISGAQRDAQLASVVTVGDGSSALNNTNATTESIISSISDFSIVPKAQEFDGYSSVAKLSDNITFGSIRLTPGNHDFMFEVVGQNDNSSGFELGIDTLSITPSGCSQEMDVYSPVDSSGDGDAKTGPDATWGGNFITEYNASEETDFVTYRLYYDTWLECNFESAIKTNTSLMGDDLYITLPDLSDYDLVWQADFEAGSGLGASARADLPTSLADITVRNLISSENIASNGDLMRILFMSSSAAPLTIVSAYIDERASGQNCVDPPVTATPGTTRMQLYFTDSIGNVAPGITIPANSFTYTNWTIFPIEAAKSYFVTFYVANDVNNSFVSYWPGTDPSQINSYLIGNSDDGGDFAATATWPDPLYDDSEIPPSGAASDETWVISSSAIYAASQIEVWLNSGEVISEIYDTMMENPNYNSSIGRTESSPTGSSVVFYGRSSDDENMSGVSWTTNAMSGSGRYAQFKAELSIAPYWTCATHGGTVTDVEYKNSSITTCITCVEPLVPAVSYPWIDNVSITWPGETKMCTISGYFAQKPNYGIITLTVDGQELLKGLEFDISVSDDVQGQEYTDSKRVEIKQRNTGK